jgi:hypothetical protein
VRQCADERLGDRAAALRGKWEAEEAAAYGTMAAEQAMYEGIAAAMAVSLEQLSTVYSGLEQLGSVLNRSKLHRRGRAGAASASWRRSWPNWRRAPTRPRWSWRS